MHHIGWRTEEVIHFPSPLFRTRGIVSGVVVVVCSKNTELLIMKLIIIRDVDVEAQDLGRNGWGILTPQTERRVANFSVDFWKWNKNIWITFFQWNEAISRNLLIKSSLFLCCAVFYKTLFLTLSLCLEFYCFNYPGSFFLLHTQVQVQIEIVQKFFFSIISSCCCCCCWKAISQLIEWMDQIRILISWMLSVLNIL